MDLKELLQDDDAVSPVIGVILMVAITVILAAVIASFVLGLGNTATESTTPQATFSFDYNASKASSNGQFSQDLSSTTDGVLTITHDGGETLDGKQLNITDGDATTKTWAASGASVNEVTAGTNVKVGVDDSDEIRVIYTSPSGKNSATLSTWTGPDA